MQNQLPFSHNYSNAVSPIIGSPKFNSQNYGKSHEKTLPTNPIRHYSSNPNLSLEINYPKPPTHVSPDFSQYSNHLANKGIDFRNHVNSPNSGNSGSQTSTRPNRSELTKSLIINDM
jgi:hypothetical protein